MRSLGALSKPLILAIDWHNEMYYVDPNAEGVVGTQPKNGSHHAYRFATMSVLVKGKRLTLAVVPMLERRTFGYFLFLLCREFELGIRVKLLLLDRGFYSIELVRWGIETSYRMVRKFLAKTTSKLYNVRKLYFYLAILLYNLWVLLNYGNGGRVIVEALKLFVSLSLIFAFLPDIEVMT
ncbi:MAG: hypothetical protein ACUVTL_08035 [Thermoproteota archaeon]